MKNCHPRSIETCNDDGCVRLELRYTTMCHRRGETVSFQNRGRLVSDRCLCSRPNCPVHLVNLVRHVFSLSNLYWDLNHAAHLLDPGNPPLGFPVLPATAPPLATASFRIPTTCAVSRLLCLLLAPMITTPASPRRRAQIPSPPSHAAVPAPPFPPPPPPYPHHDNTYPSTSPPTPSSARPPPTRHPTHSSACALSLLPRRPPGKPSPQREIHDGEGQEVDVCALWERGFESRRGVGGSE